MPVSVEIFAPRPARVSVLTDGTKQSVTHGKIPQQKLGDLSAMLRDGVRLGLTSCSITQSSRDINARLSTSLLGYLSRKLPLDFTMHLSGAATESQALPNVLETWKKFGAKNVICLRGDPSCEHVKTKAPKSSIDLIKLVSASGLTPWASGHPYPHEDATSEQANLDWTYKKIDAGAQTLVTQFCFDATRMCRWAEKIHRYAPHVDIRWGILPIKSIQQVGKIHALNGLDVPQDLSAYLNANTDAEGNLPPQLRDQQIDQLCQQLTLAGWNKFHIFSFNQPHAYLRALEAQQTKQNDRIAA